MIKIFCRIIICLLTVNILYGAGREKRELKIAFINVGHGDSILIKTPSGHTVLIDGGREGQESVIKSVLKKFGITKRIETIILSNPNSEHVGGLVGIIDKYDVGRIYGSGMPFVQYNYERFMELIMKKQDQMSETGSSESRLADIMARKFHYEYFDTRAGDILNWGPDVKVTVLSPHKLYHNTRSDPNNNSIVIKLVYKKVSFLFTGNVEKDAERYLTAQGSKIKATFFKVPNHGAPYSSNTFFVNRVKPKVSIVMVGKNNKYGYPSRKVLERLKNNKSKLYRTDLNGTIIVTTDGIRYNVTPENVTSDTEVITQLYKAEKGVEDSGNIYAQKPKININTASASELVGLPGLGAFKAQMIVKYRTRRGKFNSVNDLLKVPGFNQAVINKIKDKITVD